MGAYIRCPHVHLDPGNTPVEAPFVRKLLMDEFSVTLDLGPSERFTDWSQMPQETLRGSWHGRVDDADAIVCPPGAMSRVPERAMVDLTQVRRQSLAGASLHPDAQLGRMGAILGLLDVFDPVLSGAPVTGPSIAWRPAMWGSPHRVCFGVLVTHDFERDSDVLARAKRAAALGARFIVSPCRSREAFRRQQLALAETGLLDRMFHIAQIPLSEPPSEPMSEPMSEPASEPLGGLAGWRSRPTHASRRHEAAWTLAFWLKNYTSAAGIHIASTSCPSAGTSLAAALNARHDPGTRGA